MLEMLFIIAALSVFGRLCIFAIKCSWGLMKVLFTLLLAPMTLIVMCTFGLLEIAFPLLAVIGVISLLKNHRQYIEN